MTGELVGLATPAEREHALRTAVQGLRENDPMASASVAFLPWQRNTVFAAVGIMLVCAVLAPLTTLVVLMAVCTLGYIAVLADRVLIFTRGMARDAILTVSDERALALPEDQLPPYTILVPPTASPKSWAISSPP